MERMFVRLAREHGPEVVDIVGQGFVGIGNVMAGRHGLQDEVRVDEGGQIEIGCGLPGAVIGKNLRGITFRNAVDEGFAVAENARGLDIDEQFLIEIGRGWQLPAALAGRPCIQMHGLPFDLLSLRLMTV
jgi:hypothetical protein